MKARIIKRLKPCGCGCGGRDPWHRQTYKRVIQNIRNERGRTRTTAMRSVEYGRIGQAQFPWGVETVVEIVLYGKPICWQIAKEVM